LRGHGWHHRPQAKEGSTVFTPPGLSARLGWHRHRQFSWGRPRGGGTAWAGHRTRAPDGPRIACAPSPRAGEVHAPGPSERRRVRQWLHRNRLSSRDHRSGPVSAGHTVTMPERNRIAEGQRSSLRPQCPNRNNIGIALPCKMLIPRHVLLKTSPAYCPRRAFITAIHPREHFVNSMG
jgi:hypothetical protein